MPKKVVEKKEVKVKKFTPVKKEAVVKVAPKAAGLSVPLFDSKGLKAGVVSLPEDVFGVKINKPLMAQAVRVYLANQRQGTHSTKTRGEVNLSTRKIYKQKGTGRARHGAASAPIFVKGGVAFGPKPRDYSLKLPQKMKKAALYSALSQKVKDGDVIVVSGLSKIEPKTKFMDVLVKKISNGRKSLLVTSSDPKDLESVYRAGRNLKNLEMSQARLLNTYEVLKYKNVIFMKESLEAIK